MSDRETIIKGCENWINNHKGEDLLLTYSSVVELLVMLKERETIVRCKDCKYWHDPIRCQLDSEGLKNPDDWFCADAERR